MNSRVEYIGRFVLALVVGIFGALLGVVVAFIPFITIGSWLGVHMIVIGGLFCWLAFLPGFSCVFLGSLTMPLEKRVFTAWLLCILPGLYSLFMACKVIASGFPASPLEYLGAVVFVPLPLFGGIACALVMRHWHDIRQGSKN
jgi:hypothetical protein